MCIVYYLCVSVLDNEMSYVKCIAQADVVGPSSDSGKATAADASTHAGDN